MSECKKLTIYKDPHFTKSQFCFFALHYDVHIFAKHWFSTAVRRVFHGNIDTLTTQGVLIRKPTFLITLNKENIGVLSLFYFIPWDSTQWVTMYSVKGMPSDSLSPQTDQFDHFVMK